MPQALLFTLGAIGTAIAAKLLAREWQRVNDELSRARTRAAPADVDRETMPHLRRDPVTGEYRPHH